MQRQHALLTFVLCARRSLNAPTQLHPDRLYRQTELFHEERDQSDWFRNGGDGDEVKWNLRQSIDDALHSLCWSDVLADDAGATAWAVLDLAAAAKAQRMSFIADLDRRFDKSVGESIAVVEE